jgi:hypothetical protein
MVIKAHRYVCLSDNADHLSMFVNDWDSSDLMTRHNLKRRLKIVGRMAGHWIGCHDIPNLGIGGIPTCADHSHSQITISDDTDQLPGFVVFHHWQGTDILVLHPLCDNVDLIAGKATLWILRHNVLAFLHGFPPGTYAGKDV